MQLGERIEEQRKRAGISQAELARRVGVRQSTLNSLVNGNSRTSRSLLRIARELHTTAAYLTGDSDDPDSDADIETLSSQEQDWVDIWRALDVADRRALLHVARGLISRIPPTVNSPTPEFRGAL